MRLTPLESRTDTEGAILIRRIAVAEKNLSGTDDRGMYGGKPPCVPFLVIMGEYGGDPIPITKREERMRDHED